MEEEDKKQLHKKIVVNLAIGAAVILLICLLGPVLLKFFWPLLVAWLVAWITNPIVGFLENRFKVKKRKVSSTIVIVFVLAVVILLIYLILNSLIRQLVNSLKDLPTLFDDIAAGVQDTLDSLHEVVPFIDVDFNSLMTGDDARLGDMVPSVLGSFSGSLFSSVTSFAGSLVNALILTVLTVMMTYFFVADREGIRAKWQKWMPQGVKNFWALVKKACIRAFVSYLRALVLIMVFVFLFLWIIIRFVLQIHLAWLIALVIACFDFLPVFGAGMILLPWALYYLLTGAYVKAVVLVVTYVVTLLAHRIAEPKLIGDNVGISPLATLLSMFIGYRLIGVAGLILGIPVGMILIALKDEGAFAPYVKGIRILAHDINEYRKY